MIPCVCTICCCPPLPTTLAQNSLRLIHHTDGTADGDTDGTGGDTSRSLVPQQRGQGRPLSREKKKGASMLCMLVCCLVVTGTVPLVLTLIHAVHATSSRYYSTHAYLPPFQERCLHSMLIHKHLVSNFGSGWQRGGGSCVHTGHCSV